MDNESSMYELPINIVEQLLCSHCNSFISSGPVKMQPDGKCICGRCSPSSSDVYARNIMFETAMSKFTFPCRYKSQGCIQRMLFGKTAEHEDVCPYKTFPCPSLPHGSCLENLSVVDTYKHFNEKHLDLVTKDGQFKLDLNQNCHNNLLMIVDEITIIIQYNYDHIKNLLYLDVRHFACKNEQAVYYKMQIISGSDADRALHFKELQSHRYQSHTIIAQNATTLTMSNYLPALDNPTCIFINVLVTIQNNSFPNTLAQTEPVIQSLSGEAVLLRPSVSQEHTEEHEQIVARALNALENVRCYFCKYYSVPPIFQGYRSNGVKSIACLNCKGFLKQPQEKLYEQLTYPCRWRTCTFIGNETNIAKHEEDCLFQSCYCAIVGCEKKFYALNNLVEHMLCHGTYCPDPSRMIIKMYCNENMSFLSAAKTILYSF